MLSFPFCPRHIVIMNFFSLPLPLNRDSLATKTLQLKGQSNEIFYLQFFLYIVIIIRTYLGHWPMR